MASVLADLMGIKNVLLDERNVYDVGFRSVCELVEEIINVRDFELKSQLTLSILTCGLKSCLIKKAKNEAAVVRIEKRSKDE